MCVCVCVLCCTTSLLCMQLSSIKPSGRMPFTAPNITVIEVLKMRQQDFGMKCVINKSTRQQSKELSYSLVLKSE